MSSIDYVYIAHLLPVMASEACNRKKVAETKSEGNSRMQLVAQIDLLILVN